MNSCLPKNVSSTFMRSFLTDEMRKAGFNFFDTYQLEGDPPKRTISFLRLLEDLATTKDYKNRRFTFIFSNHDEKLTVFRQNYWQSFNYAFKLSFGLVFCPVENLSIQSAEIRPQVSTVCFFNKIQCNISIGKLRKIECVRRISNVYTINYHTIGAKESH